jgi:hypothetical protein
MKSAPVALFVYNRLPHARKSVRALQENALAKESELIVFSDGPRSDADIAAVLSVREYIKTVSGFKNVSLIEREKNLGLARSIITGVSEVVDRYRRAIILEDDLVSSPFFLGYMNEALGRYEEEEKVISIHGYVYPVRARLPETFFLKGADCWGWATWKRGWDLFEPDGEKLLAGIRNGRLEKEFDFDGAYPYTKMLEDQTRGINDSWAVRWYASAFLRDKLTLYPGRSLIKNIGTDATGTHCGTTALYDAEIAGSPVALADIPVVENRFAKKEIGKYLKTVSPGIAGRMIHRVARIFR